MNELGAVFEDGKGYERLMGRWSKLVGAQFLDWLAPASGLEWLDVGCGNGAFTEEIIARCAPAKIAAVDPSEGQLAYARTRPGAKLAAFRQADAQNLPFENQSFDVAAMALVISFIPDPAKAVAEMARVVKAGGWVATYMWDFSIGGPPLNQIYHALQAIGIEPPLPQNHAAATPSALRALWSKAGLQGIETRHIRIEAVFSGFEDYWESNSAPSGPQGVLISRMPQDQRERLRTALRDQLRTEPDGRITVPGIASAVKGRVPQ
jgi:ubiquinone/menaquinone biosynthesis C-methylase UbiE